MSGTRERDPDALLWLAELPLTDAEREGYEKRLGEDLRATIDGAHERQAQADHNLFSMIERAQQAKQAGQDEER
jgi:hypothetical protein